VLRTFPEFVGTGEVCAKFGGDWSSGLGVKRVQSLLFIKTVIHNQM